MDGFDGDENEPVVVVVELVDEGDFVVFGDGLEGVRIRGGCFRVDTTVLVAVPLRESVVVCAEAHCAAEGVAGFVVFAREEGGVCWRGGDEREEVEGKEEDEMTDCGRHD